MADGEDGIAALAVGLNEDSKAARKKKGQVKGETPFLTDYTLDEKQVEALGFAQATSDEAQREEEVTAFWRAAGDRLGFRHMTVEPAADILITGAFRALAIEPDTGTEGNDLSEGAHTLAMERMENLAAEAEFDRKSLVQDARDFLLDQIKSRPKPFNISPPGEQRDIAAACLHAAEEMVRKIAEAIAAGGRPDTIRALVTKVTLGDDIVISLKAKPFTPAETDAAVMALHRAHGKHVMIAVASKDDYSEDRDPDVPEEEPTLGFESDAD